MINLIPLLSSHCKQENVSFNMGIRGEVDQALNFSVFGNKSQKFSPTQSLESSDIVIIYILIYIKLFIQNQTENK